MTTDTGFGVEGELMAAIGLDPGADVSMVTATADSAYYLAPVSGRFVPWACG